MRLITISKLPKDKVREFFWKMLQEREPAVNISHKKMPTWEEHCAFVDSTPYRDWCVIELDGKWIGQIYLTHFNEIGVQVSPESRHKGFAREAVQRLMENYGPGRYLANIGNFNVRSQVFFRKLGFKLIQFTYELETNGKSRYDTGVTPKDTDTPLERAHRSGGVLHGKNET